MLVVSLYIIWKGWRSTWVCLATVSCMLSRLFRVTGPHAHVLCALSFGTGVLPPIEFLITKVCGVRMLLIMWCSADLAGPSLPQALWREPTLSTPARWSL